MKLSPIFREVQLEHDYPESVLNQMYEDLEHSNWVKVLIEVLPDFEEKDLKDFSFDPSPESCEKYDYFYKGDKLGTFYKSREGNPATLMIKFDPYDELERSNTLK